MTKSLSVGGAVLLVTLALPLPAQSAAEAVEQAKAEVAAAGQALDRLDRAAACAAIARGLGALDRADAEGRDFDAYCQRWYLGEKATAAGSAPGAAALAARAWGHAAAYLERIAAPDDDQFRALQEARGHWLHALEFQGDRKGAVGLQRVRLAAAQQRFGVGSDPDVIHRDILVRVLLGAGEVDAARKEMAELLARSRFYEKTDDPGRDADRLLAQRMAEGDHPLLALHEYQTIWEGTKKDLGEDHRQTLLDLENLARTEKRLGRFAESFRKMEQIVAAHRRVRPGSVELYGALENFATFLGDQRAFHDRRRFEYYEEALAGFERLAKERSRAADAAREDELRRADVRRIETCRWELAQAEMRRGDHLRARELAQRSLDTMSRELGAEARETVEPRGILAMNHSELGDFEPALKMVQENLRVLREVHRLSPLHPRLQLAWRNLAETRRHAGQPEAALAAVQDAYQALRAVPEAEGTELAGAQRQLAMAYCDVGRAADAAEVMAEAAVDADRDPDRLDKGLVHTYLARCLWLAGDNTRAAQEFDRHLESALAQEEELFDRALLLRAACCVDAAVPERVAQLTARLAALLGMGDRVVEECAALPPREAIERARLVDGMAEFVLSFAERAEPGKQLDLREHAFSLLETLRGVALQSAHVFAQAQEDPEIQHLRTEANLARARLQALLSGEVPAEAAGAQTSKVIEAAQQRDQVVFQALRAALRKHGGDPRTVTVAGLVKVLQDHEAVVCYRLWHRTKLAPGTPQGMVREPLLLAHVVTRKGLQQLDLCTATAVQGQAEAWLAAIKGGAGPGRGREVAGVPPERALAETIWRPVMSALTKAGLKAQRPVLHLCVDDALHTVPIEALPHTDGSPLLDKCTLYFAHSLADRIAPLAPPKGDGSLLVVGDVSYDEQPPAGEAGPAVAAPRPPLDRGGEARTWDKLDHAAAEVAAVKAAFGQRKQKPAGRVVELVHARANRTEFGKAAEGRQFLHVATHAHFLAGQLVAQPLLGDATPDAARYEAAVRGFAPMTLCYLVLAGANVGSAEQRTEALLTAEELAGYDLRGCELAVLSACSSSDGELRAGHGVQSLQSALHAAGARSVIATRWPVSDEYAQKLMALFYDELWVRGKGKAAALAAAQRRLRETKTDPGAAQLRHWAAFVLTGDPQ